MNQKFINKIAIIISCINKSYSIFLNSENKEMFDFIVNNSKDENTEIIRCFNFFVKYKKN